MATPKENKLMALRLERLDLQNRFRNARSLNGIFSDVEEKYKQLQELSDEIAKQAELKGSVSKTVNTQIGILSRSVDTHNIVIARVEEASKSSYAKQSQKFESLSVHAASQMSRIQELLDRSASCNRVQQFASKLNDAKVIKTKKLDELASNKALLEDALSSEKQSGEVMHLELGKVTDEVSDLQDRNYEVDQKIRSGEDNVAELTDNSERLEDIVSTLKRDCNVIEKEMQSATTDEEFFLNEQVQQHALELSSYRDKVTATNKEFVMATEEMLTLSRQLPNEWIEQNGAGCVVLKPEIVADLQCELAEKSREIKEIMLILTGSPEFVEIDLSAIEAQIKGVHDSATSNDLIVMQSNLRNELSELKNKTLHADQRIAEEEQIVLQELRNLVAERDDLSRRAHSSREAQAEIDAQVASLEATVREQEKRLEELNKHLAHLEKEQGTYELVTPRKPSAPQRVHFQRAVRSGDSDDGLESSNPNEIEGLSSFSPGTLKRKNQYILPPKVLHTTSGREVVPSSQEKNLSDLFRVNDNDGGRMIVPDSTRTQSSNGIRPYPHNMFLNDSMAEFSRPTSYPAIVSNDAEPAYDDDSLMNSMISEQSVW